MPSVLVFIVGIVIVASIYAILTLALNLEAGYGGLWDLGLVAFFAVGAYAYTIATIPAPAANATYKFGFNLPIPIGFLLAGIIAGLFAWFIGMVSLRLRKEYFLITTFAFAEVIRQIIINERWLTNGVAGFYRLAQPFKMHFDFVAYQYVLASLVVLALIVAWFIVNRLACSAFGRTLRAIRDNEDLAISAGKDVYRFRLRAFVITGIIVGFAGPLYVWYSTLIIPGQFTSDVTFTVWTALVIGGLGNNAGAVVGAFVLAVAQDILRLINVSSDVALMLASLRIAVIGILLVIILRLKPEGLFPENSRIFLR